MHLQASAATVMDLAPGASATWPFTLDVTSASATTLTLHVSLPRGSGERQMAGGLRCLPYGIPLTHLLQPYPKQAHNGHGEFEIVERLWGTLPNAVVLEAVAKGKAAGELLVRHLDASPVARVEYPRPGQEEEGAVKTMETAGSAMTWFGDFLLVKVGGEYGVEDETWRFRIELRASAPVPLAGSGVRVGRVESPEMIARLLCGDHLRFETYFDNTLLSPSSTSAGMESSARGARSRQEEAADRGGQGAADEAKPRKRGLLSRWRASRRASRASAV